MDATEPGAALATPVPDPRYAELELRMKMVERMLIAFRPERLAYLVLSVIACTVLLVASGRLFLTGDTTAAFAIFGSSGVLTLALGRVLHMWNQAWKLLAEAAR